MKRWKILTSTVAVIASAGLLASPAHADPPPPPTAVLDASALPFEPLGDAEALWGEIGSAGYRIEVPTDWNGRLVVYAHGHRGGSPILSVDNPPLRAHLIENGFAWAASTFSTNDYAPVIAAEDSKALLSQFAKLIGKPTHTYAVGDSLGGHIVKYLVEKWPSSFDGALASCSGDVELFDYFQDIYVVGETLVGNVPAAPVAADYGTIGLPALRAAMGDAFPTELNSLGQTYKNSVEMLSGGERPIFDQAWAGPLSFSGITTAQSIAMAGGGLDNLGTVYQLDTDPAVSPQESAFNASVVRIAPTKPERTPRGWEPTRGLLAPDLTGKLRVPVMSLHTLGDLFVPFSMEQRYAEKVAANGKSDLLVVRAIRDVNHCGFTAEERSRAFDDLVVWADTGVRPIGDDVLDPTVVAGPAYGCRFTEGTSFTRLALPTCPAD